MGPPAQQLHALYSSSLATQDAAVACRTALLALPDTVTVQYNVAVMLAPENRHDPWEVC